METLTSNIKISPIEQSKISEVDFDNIPFGRVFSDHMLVCNFTDNAWQRPEIKPYQKLKVYPSVSGLQYGQSIFEGMKAYKDKNAQPVFFRPKDNLARMNKSAIRMCMPEVPGEIFMSGLKALIKLDQNWIPTSEGSSLYIRPFMFATDEYIGIKPSDTYKFVIFTCPVGAYYPKPVKLLVVKEYVRAFEGGTGEAKAAGNYASSLKGQKKAKENGYDNALWLDGKEHKYVEECGTMNIFFIIDGKALTPSLTGTILDGITRNSTITLLKEKGIQVEERKITIEEVADAYRAGKLTEVFGTGTAATIAFVDKIGYGDLIMDFDTDNTPIAKSLLKRLAEIRSGEGEDTYSWMEHL